MESLQQTIAQYIGKGYLIPPERCKCGNVTINLNKFWRNKINAFSFRCSRKNCQKIYPLLDRSFFEPFKKASLELSMEIFKCFIEFKFNYKEHVII